MLNNREGMLTTKQAARMCGVSDQTIRRWIKEGRFPGATRGLGETSPYYIPREPVEAFVAKKLSERGIENLGQETK
jgi:excisionase family DNA binding protein